MAGQENCVHFTQYLKRMEKLDKAAGIVVLGASQSAVEILLDLLAKGFSNITSVHRSFSFRLKDTSPFSDEVYFPEFIDYYHSLLPAMREKLDEQVRLTNYSSVDRDIVDSLYLKMYENELDGKKPLRIFRNHQIVSVDSPSKIQIQDIYTSERQPLPFDLLILATGFLDVGRNGRAGLPALLRQLASTFEWAGEYLNVQRDYRIKYKDEHRNLPDLYMNGLCESSHGLGDAGSFSLLSLRARDILKSITGNESPADLGRFDVAEQKLTG
jgi:L-ornithine N5-oxygenase